MANALKFIETVSGLSVTFESDAFDQNVSGAIVVTPLGMVISFKSHDLKAPTPIFSSVEGKATALRSPQELKV